MLEEILQLTVYYNRHMISKTNAILKLDSAFSKMHKRNFLIRLVANFKGALSMMKT
jgi:hypothetical protein